MSNTPDKRPPSRNEIYYRGDEMTRLGAFEEMQFEVSHMVSKLKSMDEVPEVQYLGLLPGADPMKVATAVEMAMIELKNLFGLLSAEIETIKERHLPYDYTVTMNVVVSGDGLQTDGHGAMATRERLIKRLEDDPHVSMVQAAFPEAIKKAKT